MPGIYSLSPYTLEEVVARNYILDEKPDAILNIVDGTNLERNLYLTTQLLELGVPVVVAINMMDLVRKSENEIKLDKLSRALGCKVVEISALKGEGIEAASRAVCEQAQSGEYQRAHRFSAEAEKYLEEIEEKLKDIPENQKRFYAIKLFERDDKIQVNGFSAQQAEDIIKRAEKHFDDDSESIITNERYSYIASIIDLCYINKTKGKLSPSDKIDKIVTNRFLALPIFAVVMFLVYYISINTIGGWATDWVNDVLFGELIPPAVTGGLEAINCAPWLISLVVDGIIGGVGAVLGFVPQMLVLFILLALLEGCGYMARIAFIMDRIFRRFGLSGKSFIPMLIGTGCGVPGIMASRTIENERDRRMTVITTTFIPCSAKLPIIALIAGALFGGAWWVAPSAYFLGIGAIIVSGIILKKTKRFAGDPAPFVMELPAYHLPTAGYVFRSMWERASSFIKKAGTVILLSTIVLWFLQGFGIENGAFCMVEDLDNSVLAFLGKCISWLFIPLGWGNWKAAVAAVTGLIAKENVVATYGVLYHFAGEVSENGTEIWGSLASDFTMLSAYSFLAFNLLCAPCFAAIGAIKREMNSAKWTAFAIGYQTAFAYLISFMIYNIGTVFTTGFTVWSALAIVALVGFIYLIFRKNKYSPLS